MEIFLIIFQRAIQKLKLLICFGFLYLKEIDRIFLYFKTYTTHLINLYHVNHIVS